MSYPLLISAGQLQTLMAAGSPLLVFDASFELARPQAGDQQYRQAHIPGAVRAD
ncbi:MAG: sulfurtransferase, partial [Burkholderiaceae bacterium]|nr:sulfurtransferase [Burkholderiaceae bacterium]